MDSLSVSLLQRTLPQQALRGLGALVLGGILSGVPLRGAGANPPPHTDVQNATADEAESGTPDQVSQALEQLSASADESFIPDLEAAFAVFRERALILDFDAALRVGIGMHSEVQKRGERYFLTSGWSATQLALAYTRSGEFEEAERVLTERIEAFEQRQAGLRATAVSADQQAQIQGLNRGLIGLLNRRSMTRLASGDEAGGLADLGAGLARGSMNARLILARRALRKSESALVENSAAQQPSSERATARRIFSTLLEEDPGIAAWALRGWGLTLLPPSRTQSP